MSANFRPANPAPLEVDFDEANRFLKRLPQEDQCFHFRMWHEIHRNRSAHKEDFPQTFEDIKEKFKTLNEKGYFCGLVVNEGGNKNEDIKRIRAIFVDLDHIALFYPNAKTEEWIECLTNGQILLPHMIVETSPLKFHAYWIVNDVQVGEWIALQNQVMSLFNKEKEYADGGVNNLARVLRLPGFFHRKDAAKPFRSRIAHIIDDAPYSADQLRAAFPERQPRAAALTPGNVVPFPAPAASPSGGVAMAFDATAYAPAGSAGNSTRLAEAEAALWAIPPTKGGFWRHAMIALKGEGESGWQVFDRWSAAANDGSYDQHKNRELWDNATASDGGLNLIFAEAQKRGWINPNSNAAKPVQQVPQSPWQLPQPAKAKPKLGITMINSIEQTEVKWLVEGLIPADANIGIVGASSVGKTFVALALGLSAATGREFMGGEMHCVAPVIYLAGEGKHGIAKRCRAWATYYGISLENVPFAVADYLPPMTDEESVAMTIEAVQGIKDHYGHPALIIIDTLNRAFGDEDENSTAGMTKYISGIDRLRDAFPGCSTVTLHHTGHEATGRARGSSAFYAALDTELFIKRLDPWIEIEVTKQKDAAKAPKMRACLREQDVGEWGSSLVAVRDMSINRETQISMAVSSGISVRQCVENLKREGINVSKNTIMKLRQKYEEQRNLHGV